MNPVFITAYSTITSLGIGNEDALKSLDSHKNTIYIPEKNNIFKKPYFKIDFDFGYDKKLTDCAKLALKLLSMLEDKWINLAPLPLFIATSTGGIKEIEYAFTNYFNKSQKYDLTGNHYYYDMFSAIKDNYKEKITDIYTFSTACSSAGHAIMHASRFIKNGIIDKALILAVDALSITTLYGFESLKLVSEKGTIPLSKKRDGLSLGDGGAIMLIEKEPSYNPSAEILSVFSNSDGYHITSPNPEGIQQKECIMQSLNNAGIKPEDINYINAHGTGTPTNDEIEMKVIKDIFPDKPAVSSLKGFIGHTVGSSAIIELILTIQMLKNKKIYQPLNLTDPIDEDYIPVKTIDREVKYFLKNSFGFGGNNVSMTVKNIF